MSSAAVLIDFFFRIEDKQLLLEFSTSMCASDMCKAKQIWTATGPDHITKTCLYNFDPLKGSIFLKKNRHFFIQKKKG